MLVYQASLVTNQEILRLREELFEEIKLQARDRHKACGLLDTLRTVGR